MGVLSTVQQSAALVAHWKSSERKPREKKKGQWSRLVMTSPSFDIIVDPTNGSPPPRTFSSSSIIRSQPIPSNVNVQEEGPVCISFTFEGHVDHYLTKMSCCFASLMAGSTNRLPMSPGYCGYQTATPPSYYKTASNATTSFYTDAPSTTLRWSNVHQLRSSSCLVNYFVVLLLDVVTLKAGSTTGVPMYRGYGGYQTATPPSYYTAKTYATTAYYTTIHQTPKYNSAPSYTTKAAEYYTTKAAEYYTTKAAEYYTTKYSFPAFYTEVSKHFTGEVAHYATSLSYYTEAPKYYTTKTPKYYTTNYAQYSITYVAPTYYTEVFYFPELLHY
ncbi:hypothetical protein DAPPUDRAFT_265930 [Daphnia pulex]|uniref:Uncharacterized protein n=1 Tax=Daphnia pulex TaxID=6669 RepID=E9HU87_DAPPU|nr:hypothetical protein DAPPUDRAFT_265930 [Daphnia pulex]|eukprot:EFX64703.1 hypothetical protein DAPPUDRAFT_265930 [Daphnia pulex]